MKKVYSKKVGGEVFALAPEQLEVFRNAGYQTPTPEEVIADAGAAMLTPPEDKRAYVRAHPAIFEERRRGKKESLRRLRERRRRNRPER